MEICVIGFGYWGPNLVRNFSNIRDVNVKYIVELDDEKIKRANRIYPNIQTSKDYDAVLEEVDAVVIATPVSTHFLLAKKALLKKKHVLIEKPMTHSAKEAQELVGLADKNSLTLMVDHTFEYSAPVRKIKEIIENDELGKIYSISMSRLNLGLFQKDINVIWDLCPHDVSMLLYFLEKMPKNVNAVGKAHVQADIEDDCHVYLDFGKASASMHVSWLDPHKVRRVAIVGSKKMLVYDDVEPVNKISIYDKSVVKTKEGLPTPEYFSNLSEFQYSYKYGDIQIPKIEFVEPLSVMANHFVDCIKNQKTPISDGRSGLRVIKVIEAAQQSLKNHGAKVSLE